MKIERHREREKEGDRQIERKTFARERGGDVIATGREGERKKERQTNTDRSGGKDIDR